MGIRTALFGPVHPGVDRRGIFGGGRPIRSHKAPKRAKYRPRHRAATLFGFDVSRRQPPQTWNLFSPDGLYRGPWQGAQHSRTTAPPRTRGSRMFGDIT